MAAVAVEDQSFEIECVCSHQAQRPSAGLWGKTHSQCCKQLFKQGHLLGEWWR